MDGGRERRAAENEVRARRINRDIERERGSRVAGGPTPALLCECSRADCALLIKLAPGEYERIRASPTRFAVVAEHVDLTVESVVWQRASYVVVEKHGEAARIAEGRDTPPE